MLRWKCSRSEADITMCAAIELERVSEAAIKKNTPLTRYSEAD